MIGYQFTLNVARFPDAAGLVFGDRQCIFATLNERACRLATDCGDGWRRSSCKRPGTILDAARVIAHCKEHVASSRSRVRCISFDGLPRNVTNKVDRNALRAG